MPPKREGSRHTSRYAAARSGRRRVSGERADGGRSNLWNSALKFVLALLERDLPQNALPAVLVRCIAEYTPAYLPCPPGPKKYHSDPALAVAALERLIMPMTTTIQKAGQTPQHGNLGLLGVNGTMDNILRAFVRAVAT